MSSLVEVARMSKSASAKRDISKELGIFLLEPENTACWRLIFVPVPLRKSTWVKRCPSDDEQCDEDKEKGKSCALTETQKEKLAYFFSHVFDMDRDDVISLQDFEGFTERLRHFAEWSTNSGEYLILQQVQQGLIETFIYPLKQDVDFSEGNENEERTPKDLDRLFLSIDDWLNFWGKILDEKKNFFALPLWLQYFPKVVFTAINKSGSGWISKEELGAFYSSVMSYPPQKLNDLLNEAYSAMTASGDFKLSYDCYRLCFANFLFGRYPNGPGQFVFGAAQKSPPPLFPIDYTAMNTPPEDIEPFNGSLRSNRSSVIV
uniref:Sarcoplasmic calcium-binding proteins II, V, VI, and VII n=1 Tax=Lygus hesperus TaxID=30085 RepID=A0A0K8SRP9_LYGHE